jgi:hypothetical protein
VDAGTIAIYTYVSWLGNVNPSATNAAASNSSSDDDDDDINLILITVNITFTTYLSFFCLTLVLIIKFDNAKYQMAKIMDADITYSGRTELCCCLQY